MKGMFDMDSPLMRILSRICDLMILNLLFLVCSLPVITIGASLTALYYQTLKMVKDEEGGIVKGFFHSFRQNFKQSVPITLFMLLLAGCLYADLRIAGSNRSAVGSLFTGILIAASLIAAAVFSYAFPLLARFENSVRGTLLNALKVAMTHPLQTVVILLINAVFPAWFLFSTGTFLRLMWIWFLFGNAGAAWLNSMMISRIFQKLMPPEDGEGAEDRTEKNGGAQS